MSGDNGDPVELRLGEVSVITKRHLAHLRKVLPGHVITEVKAPKA